jgi:hypothetical protein
VCEACDEGIVTSRRACPETKSFARCATSHHGSRACAAPVVTAPRCLRRKRSAPTSTSATTVTETGTSLRACVISLIYY